LHSVTNTYLIHSAVRQKPSRIACRKVSLPNGADLAYKRPLVRVCSNVVLVVGILRERLLADLASPLRRARRTANSNCRRFGPSYWWRRRY